MMQNTSKTQKRPNMFKTLKTSPAPGPSLASGHCCTQYVSKFGKLSSGHRTGKCVFIPIPKKGNAKECSNYLLLIPFMGSSDITEIVLWEDESTNIVKRA